MRRIVLTTSWNDHFHHCAVGLSLHIVKILMSLAENFIEVNLSIFVDASEISIVAFDDRVRPAETIKKEKRFPFILRVYSGGCPGRNSN